jgi:anhydro-N-acetylmuramic acid kinase
MLVAGIMSGTSVDGIDVALVEIRGEGLKLKVESRAFHSIPYSPDVRDAIFSVTNTATHTSRLSQVHFLLGRLFGEAVREACERAKIPLEKLDLIGSHGQTVYHQPAASKIGGVLVKSTLQLGESALIAELTGAPVVADFRPADMAAGGEGAPLVPYVDYLLFRSRAEGRVVLNIGGIANITAIPPAGEPHQVIAFDTGPGNMVMDALAERFSGGRARFDRDGRLASEGQVEPDLLERLRGDEYFKRPPPKSTGREKFGERRYLKPFFAPALTPADAMATANALTAATIAQSVHQFVAPKMGVDEVIASGGGTSNPELMARLRELLSPALLRASGDYGIDSDAKEAIAFAVLAYESFHRRPANLPAASGARRPCVLGKICWPPPVSR